MTKRLLWFSCGVVMGVVVASKAKAYCARSLDGAIDKMAANSRIDPLVVRSARRLYGDFMSSFKSHESELEKRYAH